MNRIVERRSVPFREPRCQPSAVWQTPSSPLSRKDKTYLCRFARYQCRFGNLRPEVFKFHINIQSCGNQIERSKESIFRHLTSRKTMEGCSPQFCKTSIRQIKKSVDRGSRHKVYSPFRQTSGLIAVGYFVVPINDLLEQIQELAAFRCGVHAAGNPCRKILPPTHLRWIL